MPTASERQAVRRRTSVNPVTSETAAKNKKSRRRGISCYGECAVDWGSLSRHAQSAVIDGISTHVRNRKSIKGEAQIRAKCKEWMESLCYGDPPNDLSSSVLAAMRTR